MWHFEGRDRRIWRRPLLCCAPLIYADSHSLSLSVCLCPPSLCVHAHPLSLCPFSQSLSPRAPRHSVLLERPRFWWLCIWRRGLQSVFILIPFLYFKLKPRCDGRGACHCLLFLLFFCFLTDWKVPRLFIEWVDECPSLSLSVYFPFDPNNPYSEETARGQLIRLCLCFWSLFVF